MRIATWNVNSIRSRIDRVMGVLDRHDLDVLLVQETKCRDDQFPALPLAAAGYEYAHFGLNQWNGVAILSRVGLEEVNRGFASMPTYGDPAVAEARALGATCGGVQVWSIYVPNGRELGHQHYQYKLDWLALLRADAEGWLANDAQVVLGGDWNIAPQDEDVWSVEYYLDKTHTSPPEREAFQAILDARLHRPGAAAYARPGDLHLLGLHPARVPEASRHADRLPARLSRARGARDARRDRPRGT